MSFNRYSLDLESSSSQYAYVADNAALSVTGNFTVEGWFRFESLSSTLGVEQFIAGKYLSTGNQYVNSGLSLNDFRVSSYCIVVPECIVLPCFTNT